MASFETFVENAVKPGHGRVITGCACVAINKDGIPPSNTHICIQ
jgi:hypothetical protein